MKMALSTVYIVFAFNLLLVQGIGYNLQLSQLGSVHEHVFRSYNKYIRPGRIDGTLTVKVDVTITEVGDMNIKEQHVGVSMVVMAQWTDERLVWNATQFDNITWIIIEAEHVWKPDLVISDQEKYNVLSYNDMVVEIMSDGLVTLWLNIQSDIGLNFDVSKYPFDEQTVTFLFYSWTYSMDDVFLVIDDTVNPLATWVKSGEWDIKIGETVRDIKQYTVAMTKTRVGYKMCLSRRSKYHIIHEIAPIVLISALNILCFILPIESGERMDLSMTLFLSLTFFLTSISEKLPQTSQGVSIFTLYVGLQMFGSVFTVIMTVVIITYYNKTSTCKVPVILRAIVRWVCSDRNDKRSASTDTEEEPKRTSMSKRLPRSPGMSTETTSASGDTDDREECNLKPVAFSYKDIAEGISGLCFWLAILWNVILVLILVTYVNF